jgi:transposase
MSNSGHYKTKPQEVVMSPKKQDISTVSVVHPICCGLDVHKETVVACVLWAAQDGRQQTEQKEFGTLTDELVAMKEWLLELECPVVAIESTGVYWQAVHNVLESSHQVILVNARHIKNVPGRKTDISDSKWLAGLLRHGLVKGSFIPPKEQRHWREMTRTRKSYVQTLGDFKRMVHALFHRANIKIDCVATDLFGASGRNLMKLLCTCESALSLSEVRGCLCGSLKEKAEELYRCVQGFFEEHHRELLKILLETIEALEQQVVYLDERIALAMRRHNDLLRKLEVIPGIKETASSSVVAEAGVTLADFATAAAYVSWIGLCPGNNESGGKRRSGRTRVRANHLKTLLIEIAWAAVKKKGSYYKDKYYRLRGRLGPKKAIVAIAHRIAKAIYHIIKDGVEFKDLGEKYLAEQNKEAKLRYIKKQAELLGHELVPATNQLQC